MSEIHSPQITVAIMSHNNAAYIRRTIDSILNQSGVSFELFVFVDYSSDDSVNTLKKYTTDNRFHYEINASNLGMLGNYNKCINSGTGKYIVVLGSDDIIKPGHLASLFAALELHPESALAYTQCSWIDEEGNLIRYTEHPGLLPHSYFGHRDEVVDLLRYGNYITPSAVMLRRGALDKVRLASGAVHRPDLLAGDWELWTRIARQFPDFIFLHQTTVGNHIHNAQVSQGFYANERPLLEHAEILNLNLEDPSTQRRILANRDSIWALFQASALVYSSEIREKYKDKIEAIRHRLFESVDLAAQAAVAHASVDSVSPSNPLVSIILPTFNRQFMLKSALASICNQTYSNWEVIVVNDAGQDISDTVAQSSCREKIILINHSSNQGLAAARNTALKAAKGSLICYLDDDDLFKPNHLDLVVQSFNENTHAFIYVDAEYVSERLDGEERIELGRTPHSPNFPQSLLLAKNFIPVNCWAHKRECLLQAGFFDEALKTHEDWELLIRFAQSYHLIHIAQATVEVRQRLTADNMLRTIRLLDTFDLIYKRYPTYDEEILKQRRQMLAYVANNDRLISRNGVFPTDWIEQEYLCSNPDVASLVESKAVDSGYSHYLAYGQFENRQCKALTSFFSTFQAQSQSFTNIKKLNDTAAIVHLYHTELFEELSEYLNNLSENTDLYFSIPQIFFNTTSAKIKEKYPNAIIASYANVGRDIFPFLEIFSKIIHLNYKAICKIHTKKSRHLEDGDTWRRELLEGLIGNHKNITRCIHKINNGAGLVAPSKYLFDFKKTLFSNQNHIANISQRLSLSDDDLFKSFFAAGSMFWFAPNALTSLVNLNLSQEDFELENGQLDGTLAHAIERLTGAVVLRSGFKIETSSDEFELQCKSSIINKKNISEHFSKTEESVLFDIFISKTDATEFSKETKSSIEKQIYPAKNINIGSNHKTIHDSLSIQSPSWTVFLTNGDTLEPDALLVLALQIRDKITSDVQVIYFDHAETNTDEQLLKPYLKPDFNFDMLLSYPYVSRCLVVQTQWARAHITGSAKFFDLNEAYHLALQAAQEKRESCALFHVPTVVARLTPCEPTVFANTSDCWQALARTLQFHLDKIAPQAVCIEGPGPGTFHVIYPLVHTPLVSIVIPTRDQLPFLSRCLESLLSKTDYPAFEIIVVDNDSQTPEANQFLAGLIALNNEQIRVISAPGVFNFSRMNNLAVAQARGEFILMLNNDTAALQADWLGHMVRHALRDGVGIVGARLLYPDGKLQHAGVIMGLRGPAEHPCLGMDSAAPGYLFRAQVVQNFSAVTAACLLVSKAVYEEVGGLDEDTFGVSYNDVDFCLRVGKTGRRIVWTPLATLLHEGSASQRASIEQSTNDQKIKRFTKEQASMYQRWPKQIANDPAYNPNLSLVENGYEIETNALLRFDKLRGLTAHRVVAFAADETGCGHYRVFQPMQAMSDAGLCTGGASPEMMGPNLVLRSGADTLIFQRPYLDSDLDLLSSLLPLKGIKKIYELDDNITRVPLKSAHHGQFGKDLRGRVNKAIGLCDRLVVSTEPLAHELRGKNDDIRVVQNRLPGRMWGETPRVKEVAAERPKGGKPKVGWAGGIGHAGDLEMIGDVIRSLSDQIDWVFFGMCPDSLKPFVREFHVGVSTLDYPERLMAISQTWDLAIAPLEINAFNECKSNLKLLEYGWCGVPVVCSDITPYQGDLPCRRVKNRFADWRNTILSMTSDPQMCRQEGLRLQQTVATSWMLKTENLQSWYEAWTD